MRTYLIVTPVTASLGTGHGHKRFAEMLKDMRTAAPLAHGETLDLIEGLMTHHKQRITKSIRVRRFDRDISTHTHQAHLLQEIKPEVQSRGEYSKK